MLIQPTIFNSNIIAAQSTRIGGISPAPYQSLNLGWSVGDMEANVTRNRELFFGGLGIALTQLSKCHQVHGNSVLLVTAPGNHEGYDAQITNVAGVYLIASVADCAPILIHDEKNNAVAAIHAGWKGTAGEIVVKTMEKMKEEFGTDGKNCKAFIGACISYENFEVGEEVAKNFKDEVKRFDSERNKWFVDLKTENKNQLMRMGISESNIEVSEFCTVKNNDLFFSHRNEKGKTGRMMAVIGIRR
ncbi:MAG: peptidoglycan editing factor PgeF [Bacteroidota bacterium]|nr:peptidoglycan editing factor PgeF [Bacteroidota bacterium]